MMDSYESSADLPTELAEEKDANGPTGEILPFINIRYMHHRLSRDRFDG